MDYRNQPSSGTGPSKSQTTTRKSYTFYFGGELFSTKHLLGNALLAESIFTRSGGRFVAVLPQNIEQQREGDTSPHAIRDADIQALLACDLGLFHYDGPELDSGTVVEFMMAKFADLPAVILRTDFRRGGDQMYGPQVANETEDGASATGERTPAADTAAAERGSGDPWNLMSSFFPRTVSVVVDAMALYTSSLEQRLPPGRAPSEPAGQHETLQGNRSGRAGVQMIEQTAERVIEAFERVLGMSQAIPEDLQVPVYRWLGLMPGFKGAGTEWEGRMVELLNEKRTKGLLG